MTMLNQVAGQMAAREISQRPAELNYLIRHLLYSKGSIAVARVNVEHDPLAPERVRNVLKSAVTPMSLSALDGNSWTIDAFNESLRSASAFDRILSDGAFKRVPLNTRVGSVLTGASAAHTPERMIKMTTMLSLANEVLAPRKAAAILAVTAEVARSAAPSTAGLLGRELFAALGAAIDSAFLNGLIASGITSTATAGATATQTLTDLSVLLTNVARGSASRLYFVTTPTIAGKLSVRADTAGSRSFVGVGPMGGALLDIPLLISDGMPSGVLMLLDASRIAANSDQAVLDFSSEVTLQMDTAPDSPPVAATVMVSAFQHDLIALKADRYFGFELLATNGAAIITGL